MFHWTIPMRRGSVVPARPTADEALLLASDISGWVVKADSLTIDGQPAPAGEHRAEFEDGAVVITCAAGGVITDWQTEPLPVEDPPVDPGATGGEV